MVDISSWKVLVVDDDPGIRQILSMVFELPGGRVREASCGQEALDILQSERPTLIITDLDMPDVNYHRLMNFNNLIR